MSRVNYIKSASNVLLFIFLHIVVSCKNEKNIEVNSPIVNLSDAINIKGESKFLANIGEFYFIQLETTPNSLVYNIPGSRSGLIKKIGENIFLKSNNELLFFDSHGKFINKISAVGNGPGEYRTLYSYTYDYSTIYIYCNYLDKIIAYNLNGRLISEKLVKTDVSEIDCFNENLLFTFHKHNREENNYFTFAVTNQDQEIVTRILNRNNEKQYSQLETNSFYSGSFNNKFYYWESFYDKIYEIDSNYNIEVKLEFDYENKIPLDYSRENYLSQVYDKNLIDKVIFTDSLTFLEYSVKGKISKVVYHNTTNFCYNLNDEQISYHHWGINIGLNYLNFWPDDYFGNNQLVKILFPYELIQLRDLFKDETNNINVDPEFIRIIESIKINDNPVLFVYSQ